ncbi:MAG: hypothetical protein RLY86_922 [Pseudomonadota bacterium]|jgi:hypothetical protein
MKVTIDIECTPEEARTFLGLPDVKPMQDVLMKQLEERMSANIQAMDPENLMKTWLPLGLQNLEQIQKFMWTQMTTAMGGSSSKDLKK